MNRKWPPCVFSLRSDSFAFSLPALRLIACSDFHTGASAPALVWLSKQALVLFFFSPPPQASSFTGEERRGVPLRRGEPTHTHTHILTQPPPPTDSVLIYRWNATDSRPWTVLAAAEARSAPGSARTRTAVLSPVGLTVRAALSFTRCHDEVHLCPSFMRGRTEAAVKWEEDRDGAVALPIIKWWRPFRAPVGWWRSAAGWMLVEETGTGSRPT